MSEKYWLDKMNENPRYREIWEKIKELPFNETTEIILDLEAKLEESENQIYELQTKLNLKEYAPAFCSLAGRDCEALGKVDQLKQQLAEKDQAIEGLQEINQSLGQTCNNDAKEIERLSMELLEKDKDVDKYRDMFVEQWDLCDLFKKDAIRLEQSQNQTAIAELEKAEKVIKKYVNNFDDMNDCLYAIDQQIKELKGEK